MCGIQSALRRHLILAELLIDDGEDLFHNGILSKIIPRLELRTSGQNEISILHRKFLARWYTYQLSVHTPVGTDGLHDLWT